MSFDDDDDFSLEINMEDEEPGESEAFCPTCEDFTPDENGKCLRCGEYKD